MFGNVTDKPNNNGDIMGICSGYETPNGYLVYDHPFHDEMNACTGHINPVKGLIAISQDGHTIQF